MESQIDLLTAVKTIEKDARDKALRVCNGINDIFLLHVTSLFCIISVALWHKEMVNIKLLSNF